MDFSFDEQQSAVRDLARKLLGQLYPTQPGAAVEVGAAHAREAWRTLGGAQLLGVALPAAAGGSEAGFVALCVLLEQAGEAACPLPLIPGLVLAGLPLSEAGTQARASQWLLGLCQGERVLCGSFGERGEPLVRARRDGAGWLLSGSESCVEGLPAADGLVLAARTEGDGRALFLVEANSQLPGLAIEPQETASGHPLGRLQLQDVRLGADALLCGPEQAGALIERTLERAYLGQCAYELGLATRALSLTARFAGERQQFGRPIGTFQAVAQRLADAHIAVETMRLTLWRAAWLLEQGEDARQETAVARTIAAEAGHQVVCAAHHIHGSMGFDRDYPLYRFFLASKQNALHLGGHGYHLARLGKLLAE